MRTVAVDWSGKLKRAEEFIWLAEVRNGKLSELVNGFTREGLVARLIAMAEEEPRLVVGLDFAFSFPSWWCEAKGWTRASEVWAAMAAQGEGLLAECSSPLWGRPGKTNPHSVDQSYRRTDRDDPATTAKSVFQVGGAGAVGSGSIRGMPHLLTLTQHGFSIWPFDEQRWPLLVEIYPRALTGLVNKSRWSHRRAYLLERFPDQPSDLVERAAGSEDSFDAAVSALVMGGHARELEVLAPTTDPIYAVEGRIWRPASPGTTP